jgi:hypothetical protein
MMELCSVSTLFAEAPRKHTAAKPATCERLNAIVLFAIVKESEFIYNALSYASAMFPEIVLLKITVVSREVAALTTEALLSLMVDAIMVIVPCTSAPPLFPLWKGPPSATLLLMELYLALKLPIRVLMPPP